MRVNNFYIVRSIGDRPWEVRNSEDPSIVWASTETFEEAQSHIEKSFRKLQIEERFKDFLDNISQELNCTKEQVRAELWSLQA